MNGYLWVALGAVVGVGLPFIALRWRRPLPEANSNFPAPAEAGRASAATPAARRKPPGGFHGVTVRPCLEACQAAQAVAGERFLSKDAPALPLPGCNQARCDCTYGHYSDRRDRGDRRSGWNRLGGLAQSAARDERRATPDDRRSRS